MEEYRLWLAALEGPVPEAEARTYWNLRELPTPALDAALARATYLYVGSWRDEHTSPVPQSGRSPVLRLFEWLFFRGTIDRYQVPVLDVRLRDELDDRYADRPGDLPSEAVGADELRAFLAAHLGRGLLPEETPPVG